MCDVTFFFESYKTFLICKLDLCPVSCSRVWVYPVSFQQRVYKIHCILALPNAPLCVLFCSAPRAPFRFLGGFFTWKKRVKRLPLCDHWCSSRSDRLGPRVTRGRMGESLPSLLPPPAQALQACHGARVFTPALGCALSWTHCGWGSASTPHGRSGDFHEFRPQSSCRQPWTELITSPRPTGHTLLLSSCCTVCSFAGPPPLPDPFPTHLTTMVIFSNLVP